MAIQMRRGAWSQFDPTKMLPGEWAVILSGHPDTSNGQALYHCFAAGSVKQIATIEDAATIIANATEDIRDELTQDIASALAQVGAATNAANTATANANTATSAANAATQAATSASERAEDAIEAMGEISELAVPLISPDTRGGAKLEEHGGLALRDGALGIGSLVQQSDGYARGGLAEVTAKGHAEQDGTPTPDNPVPIEVVRGRNLWDESKNTDGELVVSNGVRANANYGHSDYIPVKPNTDYYVSNVIGSSFQVTAYVYDTSKNYLRTVTVTGQSIASGTINFGDNAAYVRINYYLESGDEHQLTLGSTPQPYVPYGHVGMEARDPDTDELISCTPIPLPQRGWVAGLPDGTADSLRLDGAGKCEWTLPTKMRDLGELTWQYDAIGFFFTSSLNNDIHRTLSSYQVKLPVLCSHYIDSDMHINTSDESWFANTLDGSTTIHQGSTGNSAYLYIKDSRFTSVSAFLAFLAQNPVTVLYSLATPVTEDCGYVDMPEISGECQVSIPELDALGIKYFVDDTVTQYGREIYARVRSEYADRLEALEAAVADLVTA